MNGQSQVSEKINSDGGIVRAIATSEVPWKRPHSQAGLGRVLILDGNTRSALAATRSLGRKGVHVIVADVVKRTLSSASRYCVESFTYPSPAGNVEGFLTIVRKECSLRRVGVILPMTELSTAIVLRHREDFRSSKVPFVGLEAFNALTDKWKLLKLAQQLHFSIPKTHFISGIHSIDAICQALKFPVVLKPHCSTIWSHGRWMSTSVHYARSANAIDENRKDFLRVAWGGVEEVRARVDALSLGLDRRDGAGALLAAEAATLAEDGKTMTQRTEALLMALQRLTGYREGPSAAAWRV